MLLLDASRCASPIACSSSDFDFDKNPAWGKLQVELDQLPTFTVANKEGQPLQYEKEGQPLAIFNADLEEAKAELTKAQEQFPELECDLIPVGLGTAYKLSCQGKALLIPSIAELRHAGAPEGEPFGQPVPLFACMEMSQDMGKGPVLPVFQSFQDCKTAVSQVLAPGQSEEELEIVGMALPSVVQRLASLSTGSGGFRFIPNSGSAKYIAEYLGL